MVREKVLEGIRAICLALPETSERLSHGAPTFFVREKRAFLMVLSGTGDGSASGSTVVLTGTSSRGLPRTPTPRSRRPSSWRLRARLPDSKSHFRHEFALDNPRRLNRVSDTWFSGTGPGWTALIVASGLLQR